MLEETRVTLVSCGSKRNKLRCAYRTRRLPGCSFRDGAAAAAASASMKRARARLPWLSWLSWRACPSGRFVLDPERTCAHNGDPMPIRRLLVLSTFAIAIAACSRQEPQGDEASRRGEDRRALERIVAIDVRASRAMREADEATRDGDAGAARLAVTRRATPAVDEAIAALDSATMKSTWGRAKSVELASILRDRKAEMPKYEQAVATGDPEQLLAAIQAQAAIERRALATVAAVQQER